MGSNSRFIRAEHFMDAVCAALEIDPSRVQGIVIEAQVHDVVHVYVQYVGDDRLLTLNWPGHLSKTSVEFKDSR